MHAYGNEKFFHTVISNTTSAIGISPNIQEQAATFWTIEGEICTFIRVKIIKIYIRYSVPSPNEIQIVCMQKHTAKL